MGLQKNGLWRLGPPRPPPKWRPTWASKNSIFEAQVGTHLGRVLAPKIDFLRLNMAPCWPHVSRQHEPMLDGQHGPMLEVNMDLCWRPTWTYVGSQHGPMFCVPGEQFCVPREQFCVPGSSSVCPGSSSLCLGSNSVCLGAVLCAQTTKNQYVLSLGH